VRAVWVCVCAPLCTGRAAGWPLRRRSLSPPPAGSTQRAPPRPRTHTHVVLSHPSRPSSTDTGRALSKRGCEE